MFEKNKTNQTNDPTISFDHVNEAVPVSGTLTRVRPRSCTAGCTCHPSPAGNTSSSVGATAAQTGSERRRTHQFMYLFM